MRRTILFFVLFLSVNARAAEQAPQPELHAAFAVPGTLGSLAVSGSFILATGPRVGLPYPPYVGVGIGLSGLAEFSAARLCGIELSGMRGLASVLGDLIGGAIGAAILGFAGAAILPSSRDDAALLGAGLGFWLGSAVGQTWWLLRDPLGIDARP